MNVIIFEDTYAHENAPATLAKPAFAVHCGVFNLYELLAAADVRIHTLVRDHLRKTSDRHYRSTESPCGPTLFLNAALVPDAEAVAGLLDSAAAATPFLIASGSRVAAACVPQAEALLSGATPQNIAARLLEAKLPMREDSAAATIDYPFDLVRLHMKLFMPNLAARIRRGGLREIRENVYAGQNVKIAETAVFHADGGPIVLEDEATIMDFALLVGPVYIGPRSRVIERATIKEETYIGPTCKVGGEVEASIIEGYSNKQHHGFLGHSYVGSWVNMGAGTSNSDLKNTYGTVKVQVGDRRLDSGMQFFGCAIGDYCKTAINTSIFTGKIVGVASMLYGFVSTNVPSFCNYARSFGQVTELSIETALEAQKRMFERRKVEQSPEDAALLRDLFRLTRDERLMESEPLSL